MSSGPRHRITIGQRLIVAGLALMSAACAGTNALPKAQPLPNTLSQAPRVEAGNVWYLGAFRVPVLGTRDEDGLRFGGNGLTYDAKANTLFMIAHDWSQQTVEISIPEPAQAPRADQLPRAQLLQGPLDATGGRLAQLSDPPSPEHARIAGQLRVDDHLLIAGFHYYDSEDTQVASHFSRPRRLDTSAETVRGPVTMRGSVPPRWLGGYMASVPPQWRSALGGSALTGQTGIPIAGFASHGPTLAVFDPQALINPLREPLARMLVGYPLATPLANLEQQNTIWNFSSQLGGVAFIAGTRSVLFFGRHGLGPYCYGSGADCNDPAKPYQGTHAYPYRYQIWAYDAADLAAVARGERSSNSLEPYAIWPLELPFARDDEHVIGGVAYDPSSQRIFLTQREGDADNKHPLVHVLNITMTR